MAQTTCGCYVQRHTHFIQAGCTLNAQDSQVLPSDGVKIVGNANKAHVRAYSVAESCRVGGTERDLLVVATTQVLGPVPRPAAAACHKPHQATSYDLAGLVDAALRAAAGDASLSPFSYSTVMPFLSFSTSTRLQPSSQCTCGSSSSGSGAMGPGALCRMLSKEQVTNVDVITAAYAMVLIGIIAEHWCTGAAKQGLFSDTGTAVTAHPQYGHHQGRVAKGSAAYRARCLQGCAVADESKLSVDSAAPSQHLCVPHHLEAAGNTNTEVEMSSDNPSSSYKPDDITALTVV